MTSNVTKRALVKDLFGESMLYIFYWVV